MNYITFLLLCTYQTFVANFWPGTGALNILRNSIGRQEVLLKRQKAKEYPSFPLGNRLYLRLGLYYSIHEEKLFTRRVRKRKITRPVCFIKQKNSSSSMISSNKAFRGLSKVMPWLFLRKKCRRITLIKSVSQPRLFAS